MRANTLELDLLDESADVIPASTGDLGNIIGYNEAYNEADESLKL